MKENLINLSFLASGHIVQDIVLVDNDQILTPEEVVAMLNSGEACTSVHEDNDVILMDGTVIATVRFSDTELEYTDFQVEDGAYEQESSLQPFNASRLARQFAIGEYVSDHEDDMDADEIIHILKLAGDTTPLGISIVEGSMDKTGNQLLREIELAEYGFKNLMTIAHAAGKKGKEII